MKVLQVEWLKIRRTALPWLAMGMPLLMAIGVVLLYKSQIQQGKESVLYVWNIAAVPFGAALLATLSAGWEQGGTWQHLLTRPVPRSHFYLSKLAWLVALAVISTALFVLCLWPFGLLPTTSELLATLLSIIVLMSLHLWIAMRFGAGACMGLGIAGVILAALIGSTGLGTTIWPVVPWAWPFWIPQPFVPQVMWAIPIFASLILTVGLTFYSTRHVDSLAQPDA